MQSNPVNRAQSRFWLIVSASALFGLSSIAPPVRAQIDNVAVLATNSGWLKSHSTIISGDVVINEAGAERFLKKGNELTVDNGVTTPPGFSVKADSIKIKSFANLNGDVFCNELTDKRNGIICQPLLLPVFDSLPDFVAQAPAAGAPNVLVPEGGAVELAPGDYGNVKVKKDATLTLTGGIYNIQNFEIESKVDVLFEGPSEIRIADKADIKPKSYVGPSASAPIDPSNIIFYVAGINGKDGNLKSSPKAVTIGTDVENHANFYVPNGTLDLRSKSKNTGAFLARDVIVGARASVTLNSAFVGNRSPVADPQTVSTDGAASITFQLTGSDPDFDDLTFSIVDPPLNGSVTVDQAPVGTPNDTVATATYTPNDPPADPPAELPDSFTFEVNDGNGGTATAVVTINPNQPPTADAQSVFTDGATFITIDLTGADPNGDDLTFSIVAPPLNGAVTLDQAPPGFPGDPPGCADLDPPSCIEDPRNDTGATATYTPADALANLEDSFVFQVDDGNGKTAQATVQINPGVVDVAAAFFAGDVSATTLVNTDVIIFFPETTTGIPGTDTPQCTEVTCAAPAGELKEFEDRPDPDGGNVLKPSAIYAPVLDFVGTDSFEFEGCESVDDSVDPPVKTNCATGFATIDILPVTDDQTVSTLQDTPVAIQLTSNLVGQQCFSIISGPDNGILTQTDTPQPPFLGPNYEYLPNPGFTGIDSFTFVVGTTVDFVNCSDDAQAVVTINVNPVDCNFVAGACDSGVDAGTRNCPEPFVFNNETGQCLCNPPFEIVDGQCVIPEQVTCEPPQQIIEGVCTDVECDPPQIIIDGVCTDPPQ